MSIKYNNKVNIGQQSGMGLIEVMVSLLLLAIGILGFVALQGSAIKSTDESLERTQSLTFMRNIGEKIRANPSESAITTYETNINTPQANAPTAMCGLDGSALPADLCTPTELAMAESFMLTQAMANYGFTIQMTPCPTSTGTYADNTMFTYCLISAWGDTAPTIADAPIEEPSDDDPAPSENYCIERNGTYRAGSECMLMEI